MLPNIFQVSTLVVKTNVPSSALRFPPVHKWGRDSNVNTLHTKLYTLHTLYTLYTLYTRYLLYRVLFTVQYTL